MIRLDVVADPLPYLIRGACICGVRWLTKHAPQLSVSLNENNPTPNTCAKRMRIAVDTARLL